MLVMKRSIPLKRSIINNHFKTNCKSVASFLAEFPSFLVSRGAALFWFQTEPLWRFRKTLGSEGNDQGQYKEFL